MRLSTRHVDEWDTLDRIRSALNVDHTVLADMMSLTSRQYERFRKAKRPPTAKSVFSLLKHVQVSFEDLMAGRIDYVALSASYRRRGTAPGLSQRSAPLWRSWVQSKCSRAGESRTASYENFRFIRAFFQRPMSA
jgi:hypothetical protein